MSEITKRQFSIAEASKILQLSRHIINFWLYKGIYEPAAIETKGIKRKVYKLNYINLIQIKILKDTGYLVGGESIKLKAFISPEVIQRCLNENKMYFIKIRYSKMTKTVAKRRRDQIIEDIETEEYATKFEEAELLKPLEIDHSDFTQAFVVNVPIIFKEISESYEAIEDLL